MNISSEQVVLLVKLVIIIALVWALIKYSVKIFMAIVAILIIFQIGFMMTGTDLNEKFKIDRFLNNGYDSAVINFFDDFRARGNKIAIVDQYEVYDAMVEGIEKGSDFVITQIQNIDIDAFAETLARNIYDAGAEAINEEELANVINKNIENVKPEDVEKIIDLTIDKLNKLKND